jgi:ribosome-binding protein aMBF1 (putative translation factor)
MSVHMKKHLTKIAIGSEEFQIPSKEAKAILSLVKNVEKAQSIDSGVNWKAVYNENFSGIPEWAICLRAARRKANLSQSELNKKTDIPVTTISKYENGERSISEKQAKKLAGILKTDHRLFIKNK